MSVVKINALEIPPQAGEEIIKRFTARMSSLDGVAGFEGFELLRPTGEAETRWFVYTRWADDETYAAWRDGEGAANAHARGPQAEAPSGEAKPPVSMGSTLLEFAVEVAVSPTGS